MAEKKKDKPELQKFYVEYGTGEKEVIEAEKFSDAFKQAMKKSEKLKTSMSIE